MTRSGAEGGSRLLSHRRRPRQMARMASPIMGPAMEAISPHGMTEAPLIMPSRAPPVATIGSWARGAGGGARLPSNTEAERLGVSQDMTVKSWILK